MPSRDHQHTVRAPGQQQVTCNDHAHAHGQQRRAFRITEYVQCAQDNSHHVCDNMLHSAQHKDVGVSQVRDG